MKGESRVLKGLVGYCELCLLVQLYVELVRGSQVDRWSGLCVPVFCIWQTQVTY